MKKLILLMVVFGLLAGNAFAINGKDTDSATVTLDIEQYAEINIGAENYDLTVTDPNSGGASVDVDYTAIANFAGDLSMEFDSGSWPTDWTYTFGGTDITGVPVALGTTTPGTTISETKAFAVAGVDMADDADIDYGAGTLTLTIAPTP